MAISMLLQWHICNLRLDKDYQMNQSQLKAFFAKRPFEPVYHIHQYFYSGSLEEFKKTLYYMMGIYKLFWLFFNVA